MKIRHALFVIFVAIPVLAFAQASAPASAPLGGELSDVDTYARIFGAVLAGLGTLFGLPIVALNFKKTRAEIRKLELEAAALQSKAVVAGVPEGGTAINIENSENVNVEVTADPRFLGPLLLLLDFIFAWVVLSLASYFLSLFEGLHPSFVRPLILGLLAAVLLLPIAKEARRVRAILRPKGTQAGSTVNQDGQSGAPPNPGPQPDVTAGAVPRG